MNRLRSRTSLPVPIKIRGSALLIWFSGGDGFVVVGTEGSYICCRFTPVVVRMVSRSKTVEIRVWRRYNITGVRLGANTTFLQEGGTVRFTVSVSANKKLPIDFKVPYRIYIQGEHWDTRHLTIPRNSSTGSATFDVTFPETGIYEVYVEVPDFLKVVRVGVDVLMPRSNVVKVGVVPRVVKREAEKKAAEITEKILRELEKLQRKLREIDFW